MFGLGMPELIVILVVALLVFGPSKLPSLGKSIGEAIRGFKKGMEDEEKPSNTEPEKK
jgi:sec-independent protein translocase protein TatA